MAPAQAAAKDKTRDNSVLCNIVTLKEWPSKVLIESCLRVNIKFHLRKFNHFNILIIYKTKLGTPWKLKVGVQRLFFFFFSISYFCQLCPEVGDLIT